MNAIQLTSFLSHPNQIQEMSYAQLENLLVEHPYCGAIRLLLVKKCQLETHPAFDQQLQLAAIHLPDRVRLHDFLKNDDELPTPPIGKIPPFPVPDNFPHNDSDETKKKTEPPIIELDGLLRKRKQKRFKLPRIPVLEDKVILEMLSGDHTGLLPKQTTAKKVPDSKSTKRKRDFLDFPVDMESFIKEIAQKRKQNASANIDPDFSHLDELANKSLVENEEAILETLAEILVKQGQRESAIKMYSALSLKFPNKSHIFAGKIAQLQTHI